MHVDVRGTIYSSVREVSKALNVTEGSVYSALSRGTQNTLGLGRGSGQKCKPKTSKLVPSGKFFTDPVKAAKYAVRNLQGNVTSMGSSSILAREQMIKRFFDEAARVSKR